MDPPPPYVIGYNRFNLISLSPGRKVVIGAEEMYGWAQRREVKVTG